MQTKARLHAFTFLTCLVLAACHASAVPNPKDPPVAVGGEGATHDDWVDFNAQDSGVLFWDDAGVSKTAKALALDITTTNPNYVLANNRTGGGAKVKHVCYKDDYGRAGGPTVAQGNTDWNNYYAGYAPAITKVAGSNCTDKTNCVSYAFDGYKAGAVCKNWVNSGADAGPFVAELVQVAASGANGGVATNAGDRCHNAEHVWQVITGGTGCPPPKGHRWKNNSSPVYEWFPNPYNNDGAKGAVANSVYGTYAIHRK